MCSLYAVIVFTTKINIKLVWFNIDFSLNYFCVRYYSLTPIIVKRKYT